MKTRKKLLIAAAIIFPILCVNYVMGEPSIIDETGYTADEWNKEVSQKADQLRHAKSSWERAELKDEIKDLGKQAPVYYSSGSQ